MRPINLLIILCFAITGEAVRAQNVDFPMGISDSDRTIDMPHEDALIGVEICRVAVRASMATDSLGVSGIDIIRVFCKGREVSVVYTNTGLFFGYPEIGSYPDCRYPSHIKVIKSLIVERLIDIGLWDPLVKDGLGRTPYLISFTLAR